MRELVRRLNMRAVAAVLVAVAVLAAAPAGVAAAPGGGAPGGRRTLRAAPITTGRVVPVEAWSFALHPDASGLPRGFSSDSPALQDPEEGDDMAAHGGAFAGAAGRVGLGGRRFICRGLTGWRERGRR
jgi:hypothetical protein